MSRDHIPSLHALRLVNPMGYVHGHAACLDNSCPMFGLNQAECCGGETAETCPASTSEIFGLGSIPSTGDGRSP